MIVEIGGLAVKVNATEPRLLCSVKERLRNFRVSPCRPTEMTMDAELDSALTVTGDAPRLFRHHGKWRFERIGVRAEFCFEVGSCSIRQAAPDGYFIEVVLRALQSLWLARRGGFLVHAASHVRNGRAVIFTGVSGAGKSTISHFAPPDSTLLTDELSLIRPWNCRYYAFGTPYVSSLGKPGENISAPIEALYFW